MSAGRAALLCALAMVACDGGPRHAVEVSARWTAAPPADPSLALQPLAGAGAAATAEQRDLHARIEADPQAFLESQPGTLVLNEAELVYFALAQTPALATHYRDAADRHGDASSLRPRLAWLYQRLGQPALAREHAALARSARPDDPHAHFVYGFVRSQDSDPQGLADARTSYARVLTLAPDYVGPGGVSASDLRAQLGR